MEWNGDTDLNAVQCSRLKPIVSCQVNLGDVRGDGKIPVHPHQVFGVVAPEGVDEVINTRTKDWFTPVDVNVLSTIGYSLDINRWVWDWREGGREGGREGRTKFSWDSLILQSIIVNARMHYSSHLLLKFAALLQTHSHHQMGVVSQRTGSQLAAQRSTQ